jgi:prephenate dehydrogenase
MKLAIIGPGLIGRSVALAARRAEPDTHVIEIDRGESLDAARGADLIVLATPVNVILDVIRTHHDILRSSITVDTGSTKRAIVSAARGAGLDTFVGGHPMAGAVTSGPEGARADLFVDRPWFLVPYAATATARHGAQAFVQRIGAQPIVLDDDGAEHDRVMAAVSHLPQVVAAALMVVAADAAGARLAWAGNGLRDTTRLAQSNSTVWQSILDSNADELKPLLRILSQQLSELADQLGDGRSVSHLLDKANSARALI